MLVTLVMLLKAVLRCLITSRGPFVLFDAARRQQAIAARHNHREITAIEARSYQRLEGGGINRGVGDDYTVDANGARQVFNDDFARGLMFKGTAGSGMLLQAGHG